MAFDCKQNSNLNSSAGEEKRREFFTGMNCRCQKVAERAVCVSFTTKLFVFFIGRLRSESWLPISRSPHWRL
ncbi:hypothetical protein M5D96_008860 [Drosophila gunungcola]|uniref:Uncharacterized protein n=1 Tax=Drosophila gunungcola TaxID=103775 RepID=A0A9P9YJP0_9MUSC|nr:hypothetical protein M5D96_008860 [Drosophila gunungcola]